MAKSEHSAEGFGSSLTDLMTSIAVIFILLFLVFLQNQQDELASRERLTERTIERLFAQLEGELSAGVEIKKDEDDPLTLLIVLRDDPELLSFKFNQAEVRDKSRRFLERFIPQLTAIVCEDSLEPLIDSIIIEGHTDSRGSDDSNTDLSARRATAVLIESRQILSALEQEVSVDLPGSEKCFLRLSQATGRGEQELVTVGGVEDLRMSRRVVVKVRVKSLEQRAKPISALSEADSA